MKTSPTRQFATLLVFLATAIPAWAHDPRCPIDWNQFDLNPQQAQQMAVLDSEWDHSYNQLKPELVSDQGRLSELLADSKSDPLEVVTLQETISRKKQQLRSLSTSIYLRKRQILNTDQQHRLEERIREYMEEKRRQTSSGGSQTEAMPDAISNLLTRVRSMWTKPGVP